MPEGDATMMLKGEIPGLGVSNDALGPNLLMMGIARGRGPKDSPRV